MAAHLTGNKVTQANAYVGLRVIGRNDVWEYTDGDGGDNPTGVIVNVHDDYWADVKWDNGDENNYQIGNDVYDLEIEDPVENLIDLYYESRG